MALTLTSWVGGWGCGGITDKLICTTRVPAQAPACPGNPTCISQSDTQLQGSGPCLAYSPELLVYPYVSLTLLQDSFQGLHLRSSLLPSSYFGLLQVFSFKLRGAYNKMTGLTPQQRAKGVICSSAGNHAQGVALAANKLV